MTDMTRFILSTLLVLGLAAPSFADVTVKTTASGKGNKMPTDTVMGDTTRTMIFDVDNQRLYFFDSKKKEAEAWDMQAFGTNINSAVDAKGQPGQAKVMAESTSYWRPAAPWPRLRPTPWPPTFSRDRPATRSRNRSKNAARLDRRRASPAAGGARVG